MATTLISVPQTNFLDSNGRVSRAWLQWLLNPQVQTVVTTTPIPTTSGGTGVGTAPNMGQVLVGGASETFVLEDAVPPSSGGTGLTTAPGTDQILIGAGGGFAYAVTLPTAAFPALTGDISNAAGSLTTTLTTVNLNVGSFGTATQIPAITVDAKGRITAAANTNITGAQSMTVVGAFGCNTKTAQAAAASGTAVAVTASTNIAPFGYTTAAQADRIVALLNTIQAALIANGILS